MGSKCGRKAPGPKQCGGSNEALTRYLIKQDIEYLKLEIRKRKAEIKRLKARLKDD